MLHGVNLSFSVHLAVSVDLINPIYFKSVILKPYRKWIRYQLGEKEIEEIGVEQRNDVGTFLEFDVTVDFGLVLDCFSLDCFSVFAHAAKRGFTCN